MFSLVILSSLFYMGLRYFFLIPCLSGMKHPKTPGLLENSLSPWADEEEEEEDEGERTLSLERRPKRERRQSSVTLCKVCNIQLNSAAQAQIHYNGKTHQRRLRQHSKATARNAHTGWSVRSLDMP